MQTTNEEAKKIIQDIQNRNAKIIQDKKDTEANKEYITFIQKQNIKIV
jgi:hypothetical protein